MPIISQSAAAKLASVSRQAIQKLKLNPNYDFFTDNGKVDTDSESWKEYLYSRGLNENLRQERVKIEKAKNEIDVETVQENNDFPIQENDTDQENINTGQKEKKKEHVNGLTGGYDPADYPPTNAQQLKSITDVIKSSIEMRMKLGEYVRRDILESYMNEISRNIQIVFVDLARSCSVDIAEMLDKIGMEKEIEKQIAPKVSKGIEDLKRICTKVNNI